MQLMNANLREHYLLRFITHSFATFAKKSVVFKFFRVKRLMFNSLYGSVLLLYNETLLFARWDLSWHVVMNETHRCCFFRNDIATMLPAGKLVKSQNHKQQCHNSPFSGETHKLSHH